MWLSLGGFHERAEEAGYMCDPTPLRCTQPPDKPPQAKVLSTHQVPENT